MAFANSEEIYKVWKECGQNLSATERELKKLGYSATRQTISKWVKEEGWAERAAREAAEAEKLEKASSEDGVLLELISQKDKYIEYFRTLPAGKIDTQATYAYVSLVNAIRDYRIKVVKMQAADDATKAAKSAGLSDEAVKEIQERILGL